jgi:hypothetical protein
MLPEGFPKWRTVLSYFAKWSEPGQDGISVLNRALKNQAGNVGVKQGRNAIQLFDRWCREREEHRQRGTQGIRRGQESVRH